MGQFYTMDLDILYLARRQSLKDLYRCLERIYMTLRSSSLLLFSCHLQPSTTDNIFIFFSTKILQKPIRVPQANRPTH